MKKVLTLLLVSLMILPTTTFAKEEIVYYTNLNGATLTKEQYNRLIEVFDEDTIYTMTLELINNVKNQTNFKTTEVEKYMKVESYYNRNGDLIERTEKEVTKEEALNDTNDGKMIPYNWNVTYQTNMKRLYMKVVSATATDRIVTITNTWLSIPSVKSYDVIAVRPGSNAMSVNLSANTISGYQKWDGNYVYYDTHSANTKKSSSFTGKGGVGISMNIVDGVTSSLENSMTVQFISGSSPFKIFGTYQHATSNLTLADSQNYSFSSLGLGEVLNFASSVKSKYDNMKGVKLEYIYAEEIYG